MKKNLFITAAWVLLSVSSCKDAFDNVEVKRYALNEDQSQVLQGLAEIENAIVSDWVRATEDLQTSVSELVESPSTGNLMNALVSWKLARDPWESNESFGFGPVGNDGIDGNSDDWPFDVAAFNAILTSSQNLSEAFITQMTTATKGFHAIEYILFGMDGNKGVTDFTDREFTMLNLLVADLNRQASMLRTRWTTGTNKSFYDDFKNAGQGSSSYPTAATALAEVLGSMVDIMTELPDSKLETPLTTQNVAYLESHFSDYSHEDYRNNLNGVYSVYIGRYKNVTTSRSISSLVEAANPAVNEKVVTQFKLCLASIDLISPTTMNVAIFTKQDQLRDLQTALRKLNEILREEVSAVLELE